MNSLRVLPLPPTVESVLRILSICIGLMLTAKWMRISSPQRDQWFTLGGGLLAYLVGYFLLK